MKCSFLDLIFPICPTCVCQTGHIDFFILKSEHSLFYNFYFYRKAFIFLYFFLRFLLYFSIAGHIEENMSKNEQSSFFDSKFLLSLFFVFRFVKACGKRYMRKLRNENLSYSSYAIYKDFYASANFPVYS